MFDVFLVLHWHFIANAAARVFTFLPACLRVRAGANESLE